MRRRILLPLIACVSLVLAHASIARSQDLDLPVPPRAEAISPGGLIPEGSSLPAGDAEMIDQGFPIGAPVSMIDTPLTPVPYPGVELWEGYCNHHDGLSDVCCDCQPCAWGSLDVLWLQRDEGDNVVFAVNDDADPILQSSQFGFDYEAGVRLTYGRLICCTPVEITYFGAHNWNSSIDVTDADDVDVLVAALPNGAFTDADEAAADYSSDLHSLELNTLHYDCCRDVTLLLGARFISLDEQLGVTAQDETDGDASLNIDADNYLFGVQAGGVFSRTCGRWTFGATAKAGVFANFSEADFSILEADGTALPFADRVSLDSGEGSFVGEAILGVDYCLGAGFSLRAGYQLTWLHGVALASEQFSNADYQTGFAPTFNADGQVLYDGGYLGLGWTR